MTPKNIFTYLFFIIQLICIVVGQITETKFFNWVPYDEISRYHITVKKNNEDLGPNKIKSRYRKSKAGRENRNLHNLISIIKQCEETYGKNDNSKVQIKFLTNGYRKSIWYWPEDTLIKE